MYFPNGCAVFAAYQDVQIFCRIFFIDKKKLFLENCFLQFSHSFAMRKVHTFLFSAYLSCKSCTKSCFGWKTRVLLTSTARSAVLVVLNEVLLHFGVCHI